MFSWRRNRCHRCSLVVLIVGVHVDVQPLHLLIAFTLALKDSLSQGIGE